MSPSVIFHIVLGLLLLSFCGDALVRGSIRAGLKFNISPLIIGLTVVAFGTSAPELIVAIQASLTDLSGLALGNVIGSNIANVMLVLGLPILIFSMDIKDSKSLEDFWIMFGATLLFMLMLILGLISAWQGVFLIIIQILVLLRSYRLTLKAQNDFEEDIAELSGIPNNDNIKTTNFIILITLGIVGLPLGAHYLIEGAVGLAKIFNVSEEIIGLSVVAVGTSLPELATTFSAVWRRQGEVVLGNIIGSNLFNILFIVGIAAIIAPLGMNEVELIHSLGYLFISLMLFMSIIVRPRVIRRLWGFIFVSIYATYLWFLVG